MENMLEEYMADMMIESDYKEDYKEDSFEAFESDEDSMLILGQPIDDQITTKNIASFAIPKRHSEDGTEISEEEYEYEDSFESPGKSPTHNDNTYLNDMSSITFTQSKTENNPDGYPHLHQGSIEHSQAAGTSATTKKKVKKKKKRAPSAASVALGQPEILTRKETKLSYNCAHPPTNGKQAIVASKPPIQSQQQHLQHQQHQHFQPHQHGSLPLPHHNLSQHAYHTQSGSQSSARDRAHPSNRLGSAGVISSTVASRGVSSGTSRATSTSATYYPHSEHNQISQNYHNHHYLQQFEPLEQQQYQQQVLQQEYKQGSTPRTADAISSRHSGGASRNHGAGTPGVNPNIRTPGIGQGRQGGPPSVTSQVTQVSVVRNQGVSYANGLLQRQLDNALKQVNIYRKENEALQHSLDSAGISEAVERYKALLIEKETRISQLESENNGLKSIARYQGKYLSEQAKDAGNIDSIMQHEKQIEIMLIHTRKMKEKAKKLEVREQELMAENERLHVQNGRIQRKNAKLKKQLLEQSKASSAGQNQEHSGDVSQSMLDALEYEHRLNTQSTANDSTGKLQYLHQNPDDHTTGATSLEALSSTAPIPANTASDAITNSSAMGSSTGPMPSTSLHFSDETAVRESGNISISALSSAANNQTSGVAVGAAKPIPTTKVGLRKALAEKELVLRKQQIMIETFERSLQSQRMRFMKDIENYKAQADHAISEQRRLEQELEKRERFGRNQVSTLKQIRSAYDELSTGYRKLLNASELYNRDMAPAIVHPKPTLAPGVQYSPEQRAQAHIGVLSEQDLVIPGSPKEGGRWDREGTPDIVDVSAVDSRSAATGGLANGNNIGGSQSSSFTPVRPTSSKRTDSGSGARSRSARQMAANLVQGLPTSLPGAISTEE